MLLVLVADLQWINFVPNDVLQWLDLYQMLFYNDSPRIACGRSELPGPRPSAAASSPLLRHPQHPAGGWRLQVLGFGRWRGWSEVAQIYELLFWVLIQGFHTTQRTTKGICHLSCAAPCGREGVHGYLAHKKTHPPRTLQQDCAYAPTAVLGGGSL